MKKIGKHLGKKIAFGFIAFGFVAASALVNAQEHVSRACQDQTKMVESVQANMVKHQTQLHEQLKLTEAQEPAWKNFVASMPAPAKPTRLDRAAMEKLTTPERMEQQLNMLKEHEAKMTANLLALKTFYAALTPEQQKTFDDYHSKMGRNAHHKADLKVDTKVEAKSDS
ncbi:Spy/CpxP family protein refolding chaperone [Solimicrobium silvestre]|uniref:LTXXQ motif family protein n=1 Tax=Solimicrobium silvestre TaxID=2099400 RepID=A0A2S9H2J5_9BURK|nr:Spy/CpxP family protein refolding chaperone [Solimicrobium silvestre]PRC94177.1 LTXXQ motif family protein [Solimicrobium silvestre]